MGIVACGVNIVVRLDKTFNMVYYRYMSKEEAIKLYNQGFWLTDVHKMTGHCPRTIKKWLKEENIPVRKVKKDVDEKAIIEDYVENLLTQAEICRKYKITHERISKIFDNHNVKRNKFYKKLPVSTNDLAEMYNNGISLLDIGKVFGVSADLISLRLEDAGVQIKTRKDYRKYELDRNYFDEIDDQNKAYILGLLYADGTNLIGKAVQIGLQENDKNILYQIRDLIYSDDVKPPLSEVVKKSKNHKTIYKLSIDSVDISESLLNHGLYPNKAKIIKFPHFLDKKLYRHFIRGFFDGDGSITMKTYFTITSASEIFLRDMLEIILKDCGFTRKKLSYDKRGTWQIVIGGRNQIRVLYHYLYDNSNLKIERKYKRFQKILNINK